MNDRKALPSAGGQPGVVVRFRWLLAVVLVLAGIGVGVAATLLLAGTDGGQPETEQMQAITDEADDRQDDVEDNKPVGIRRDGAPSNDTPDGYYLPEAALQELVGTCQADPEGWFVISRADCEDAVLVVMDILFTSETPAHACERLVVEVQGLSLNSMFGGATMDECLAMDIWDDERWR